MSFELMDVMTGNLVGVYSTQEAALHHVAEAYRAGGDPAIDTLALSVDDPTGETDGHVVAEGKQLLDLLKAQGSAAA